jgi:hypothetical protein
LHSPDHGRPAGRPYNRNHRFGDFLRDHHICWLRKKSQFHRIVIPAKAGIQLFQDVLDPGACPGPDPGFAGVTIQETFYETIISAGSKPPAPEGGSS